MPWIPRALRLTALALFLHAMVGCIALAQAEEPTEVEVSAALAVELSSTVVKAPDLLFTTKAGTKVAISCKKLALEKALLEEAGKGSGTGSFSGCTIMLNGELAPGCKAHSAGASTGTIKTLALKSQLVSSEGVSLVKVEPQSETTLAKIEMGTECAIGELVKVAAKAAGEGLWLKESPGQLETLKVAHSFEEASVHGLIALGQPATLDGSASIGLSGAHLGREWRGLVSVPAWYVGT